MRRPPGLWILLSAGVVWLSLQDVYGIRATSLIFGKSTTTSTTTTTTAASEQAEASEEETVTTELSADPNSTKPTLTGNPQIDYIWDPNLPKELNGYNLSDYPFYERVPEDIDFKCDGLHDGFYASVPHKCQVYHHCLFGTRYDFLCANYTAFDQTLFNCNFVSNVDCENSKKFWHRNDELYIEKSTTTAAPAIAYNFYTPPPQGAPLTPAPILPGQQQLPQLPPPEPIIPRRPAGARSRSHARPRPQYDYYEEDYEELPRPKGRKRRPRPRPIYYDDDYEDYEERLPRRNGGRRRLYYRDRVMRRSKDRRKIDYDDDDVDFRLRYDDYDDVVLGKPHKDKRRKYLDDYDEDEDDDRRERYDRRRPANRRSDKPIKKADKRILFDDDYDEEEEVKPVRRRTKDESRNVDRRRPFGEDNKKIPTLGKRRPPSEDFEDDLQRADISRSNERTKKGNRESSYVKPPDDGRPIIKPVSGTIYDRPRVAPRINLPVPKNAAEKFAYKPLGTKVTPAPKVEEIDDDLELEEPSTKKSKYERRNTYSSTESSHPSTSKPKEADHSETPLKYMMKPKLESSKSQSTTTTTTTPASKSVGKGPSIGKGVTSGDYEDYYDDDLEEEKPSGKDAVKSKPSSTSTTTTESLVDHSMPIIRKFKRPFLPSRGGNPLSARGLQPVGSKSSSGNETQGNVEKEEPSPSLLSPDLTKSDTEEIQEVKPDLKPIPVRVKSPILPKSTTMTPAEVTPLIDIEEIKNVELESDIKPGPIRVKVPIRIVPPITERDKPQTQNGHGGGYELLESETTEKTKLSKTDILNGNYDVTLNEAISPIIPKLPVRSFGGYGPTNDYTYKRIQRPTKYVILDPVVSAGTPYYVKK